MDDFVFGGIEADEQRLLATERAARSGVRHFHAIEPLDPLPGQPVRITVQTGPEIFVDRVTAYVTFDGSFPEGNQGKATRGLALPLQPMEVRWEPLLWDYVTLWQGEIPAQPAGTLVQYRIEAWRTASPPCSVWSSEINLDRTPETPTLYGYHVDALTAPDWAREAVIYHILVDRFAGGEHRWLAPEEMERFTGGSLRGVIERLDYIADLGVTAIWLSPVFVCESYHGYDPIDFFNVDPRFGTNADLLELFAQAHARGLRVLLDGGTVVGRPEEALEIRRALPHGHVSAVLATMRRLDVLRLLSRSASRERDLALALIASRVIAPGSKLATVRALSEETATSSLGRELGLGAIREAEIYAALDWLGEQQARIERALARRHLHDGTLVPCDVSSSHLEGRRCELARQGYSRDHRPDRLRIVHGLLCGGQGRPVAVELFAGDTADPATLGEQIDKPKPRFGLRHVVLVGGRGMITAARIRDDLRPAGLDWITSLRAAQIQALAEAGGPLQLAPFDERDRAEIGSPDWPGERLVVCRNPDLARERTRKRAALLAATQRDLARIAAAVRRKHKPLRGQAEIGLAAGAVIDRHKMAKHFALTITEDCFAWRRNDANIEREARLDGLYVIRTNVPASAMDATAAVRAYKDLARVERAFRTLKGIDLQIRPVHHRLAPRVRAHVFLCMLAYYVEWHLREAWAPLLFHEHDAAGAEAERISPVQAAAV